MSAAEACSATPRFGSEDVESQKTSETGSAEPSSAVT